MEVNKACHSSRIGDDTGIGEARRAAVSMAAAAGFNETDTGKVAIAVTEAAANVLKHGGGGEILLRPFENGLEMLAFDKGPGIANLPEALRDGQSTAGSAGIGLGAIERLSASLEIYTGEGMGAAMVARFHAEGHAPDPPPQGVFQIGVAQSPYPGELSCGDAWVAEGNSFLMVDGLGHGREAAVAAAAAVEAFGENRRRPVRDVVEAVHLALRSTRGAAVALAEADPEQRLVRFCGLGNITAAIVNNGVPRGMMSHNGTAGHEFHRIAQLEYAWPEGALLVMHTDGLSAKWDLLAYPGLMRRHPSLIAAVLYRDFRRVRDDATVLVARVRPRPEGEAA